MDEYFKTNLSMEEKKKKLYNVFIPEIFSKPILLLFPKLRTELSKHKNTLAFVFIFFYF